MSVDRLLNGATAIPGTEATGRDRESLEHLKSAELAREFESMLLLQMLRQMRQAALDDPDEEQGLSASTMFDTVDAELARQLSKTGGMGLADVMIRAIRGEEPTVAGQAAESGLANLNRIGQLLNNQSFSVPIPLSAHQRPIAPSAPVDVEAAGQATPGEGEAVLGGARTTSDFGWRNDPFTGGQRFHHGVDLRAAYGQEVPAAAAGRVIEAADRGPYGLTVLVEHEGGVRTRYAHLSEMTVGVGDRVLQGQEIGRVGQSGRATGPHLHFEVIRNGQRVDPATVATLQGSGLGGLKLAGVGADFPIGGRTHSSATVGVDDED